MSVAIVVGLALVAVALFMCANSLGAISEAVEKGVCLMDQIRAELGRINAATTDIAEDIRQLMERVTGNLTTAEVAEIKESLAGIATTLEGVAAKYPAPPEG